MSSYESGQNISSEQRVSNLETRIRQATAAAWDLESYLAVVDENISLARQYTGQREDMLECETALESAGLAVKAIKAVLANLQTELTGLPAEDAEPVYSQPAEPALPEPVQHPAEANKARAYKGRVLIIDDDETIRYTVADLLGYLDYEAEAAPEGQAGLEMYARAKAERRPFDYVLLDLTIHSGMGGKETVRRLLELDPQARAIVSSGYSDEPIMANFADYGFKGVLNKPFNIKQLQAVLESID